MEIYAFTRAANSVKNRMKLPLVENNSDFRSASEWDFESVQTGEGMWKKKQDSLRASRRPDESPYLSAAFRGTQEEGEERSLTINSDLAITITVTSGQEGLGLLVGECPGGLGEVLQEQPKKKRGENIYI